MQSLALMIRAGMLQQFRLGRVSGQDGVAREAFRGGRRNVLFPPGSYNARVLLGARVRALDGSPVQAA